MPTPVGHSLIAAAIGLAPRRKPGPGWLLACIVIANLPDLDYVPGILTGDLNAFHHGYTHTLGWILLVGVGIWLLARALQSEALSFPFALILALLASHLVADWLTADGRAPYGIMAFWPFSDRFLISPVSIFPHVKKLNWAEVFQWHNVRVALIEALVVLPLLAVAAVRKARAR